VGTTVGDPKTDPNENEPGKADSSTDACNIIEDFGGPNLARPEYAFFGFMSFIILMHLSGKALERNVFGVAHMSFWIVGVIAGVIGVLSIISIITISVCDTVTSSGIDSNETSYYKYEVQANLDVRRGCIPQCERHTN